MQSQTRRLNLKRGLAAFLSLDLILLAALIATGGGAGNTAAPKATGIEQVLHVYICGSDRKAI